MIDFGSLFNKFHQPAQLMPFSFSDFSQASMLLSSCLQAKAHILVHIKHDYHSEHLVILKS